MAKGKHATALFEVIHSGKQMGGKDKAAGLLRTPKWWFKDRKPTATPEAESVTAGAPMGSAPPAPVAAAASEADQQPPSQAHASAAAATPGTQVAHAAQVPPPPPAVVAPDSAASVSSASNVTAESPPAPRASRPPAVDVLVDSQRQQITFRVSYTSAIVTAFSILVVVGLAYLVGRHMSRGPAPALGGPSTEEIRQGAAHPEVMDVGRGASQQVPRASGPARNENLPVTTIPPTPQPQPRTTPQRGPASAPAGPRTIGLNYVIIQGYPDEANAKAAVDILKTNGVDCTIEKGLRGLNRDWFLVTGTEGFSRISGPQFEGYLKRIHQISDKFAGSRRSFKAFEPLPYKWDRP